MFSRLYERDNVAEMRRGQNLDSPLVSAETWRHIEEKHPHLSSSQRAAVEHIASSHDGITGLEGVTGTLKSLSMQDSRKRRWRSLMPSGSSVSNNDSIWRHRSEHGIRPGL